MRELGYLFLTMSSLHIIASDLYCMLEITALVDEDKAWMMSNPITKYRICYNNMLNYSKSTDVK